MNTDNLEKKTLIDSVDDVLLGIHAQLAKSYVNKTGRSKADLEEEIYCGSTILLGLNTFLTKEYVLLIPMAVTGINAFVPKSRPGKTYFKNNTTTGQLGKWASAGMYFTGALGIVIGAGGIVAGATSGNKDFTRDAFEILGLGLATFGWMGADYISRADIEKKDETK